MQKPRPVAKLGRPVAAAKLGPGVKLEPIAKVRPWLVEDSWTATGQVLNSWTGSGFLPFIERIQSRFLDFIPHKKIIRKTGSIAVFE